MVNEKEKINMATSIYYEKEKRYELVEICFLFTCLIDKAMSNQLGQLNKQIYNPKFLSTCLYKCK